MSDSRLAGADFIRAAACMLVVGHHLSQRMSWNGSVGWMEWLRFFTQIGGLGVAVFFVLSGFLLARPFWSALDARAPLPSLRTYALRRAARILPGYWLALSVTFVLSFTAFGVPVTGQLIGRYVSGMFLVADWHWVTLFPAEVNGPLWSISLEVTSYVLLALSFAALFAAAPHVGARWRARLLWLAVIALALVAHLIFVRLGRNDPIRRGWDYGLMGGAKLWMPRYNPFSFFSMFAAGALAAGFQVRLAGVRHWAFDILSLGGLAAVAWSLAVQSQADGTEAFGFLGVPHDYPWLQVTIGLVLAVTPSSRIIGSILDNPVSRYVARVSFGIYLWHYLVLELIRVWWVPDIAQGSMADPTRMALVSGAVLLVTFVIADLSFRCIEAPIIRRARGFERRAISTPTTLSPAAG